MKWAHSLIRISNHQVEVLQKRLAVLAEARMNAEMKLVMLQAEAEVEAAHGDVDAQAGFYRLGFLQGWRGTFWERMSHPAFFLMIGAIGFVSALMVWAMEKPLRPFLEKSHD